MELPKSNLPVLLSDLIILQGVDGMSRPDVEGKKRSACLTLIFDA